MYRWVDHTSELELEIEAASERELLVDALRALAELLDPAGAAAPTSRPERLVVEASAQDQPTLLAGWLDELLYLAETSGFIPSGVEQLSLEHEHLRAAVSGRRGNPRPLVKAVTYHRLAFEPTGRGYRGRVIFDV